MYLLLWNISYHTVSWSRGWGDPCGLEICKGVIQLIQHVSLHSPSPVYLRWSGWCQQFVSRSQPSIHQGGCRDIPMPLQWETGQILLDTSAAI